MLNRVECCCTTSCGVIDIGHDDIECFARSIDVTSGICRHLQNRFLGLGHIGIAHENVAGLNDLWQQFHHVNLHVLAEFCGCIGSEPGPQTQHQDVFGMGMKHQGEKGQSPLNPAARAAAFLYPVVDFQMGYIVAVLHHAHRGHHALLQVKWLATWRYVQKCPRHLSSQHHKEQRQRPQFKNIGAGFKALQGGVAYQQGDQCTRCAPHRVNIEPNHQGGEGRSQDVETQRLSQPPLGLFILHGLLGEH